MSIDDFSGIHVSIQLDNPSLHEIRLLKEHFFSDFGALRDLSCSHLFSITSQDKGTTIFFRLSSVTSKGKEHNFLTISTEEHTNILAERGVTMESMAAVLAEDKNPTFTVTVRAKAHSTIIAEGIASRLLPSDYQVVPCYTCFSEERGEYDVVDAKSKPTGIHFIFSNRKLTIVAPKDRSSDFASIPFQELESLVGRIVDKFRNRTSPTENTLGLRPNKTGRTGRRLHC